MANLTFGTVLSDLIAEKNIEAQQFARDIGVDHSTVSTWCSDTHGIQLPNLIKICRYFGCSLEYLAGRTTALSTPVNFPNDNFGQRVRKIRAQKGITLYRFCKETRLGYRQTDWDRGSAPKLTTLVELADYLGCTLDELVGIS